MGCVIVSDNRIIGKGYNQIETLKDPTAHAEIIAITAAAAFLGSRRLVNTALYVTLEPCAMCAGAIVQARIPRLVFGAFDPKAGACGTLFNIVQDQRLNHRADVVGGNTHRTLRGVALRVLQTRARKRDGQALTGEVRRRAGSRNASGEVSHVSDDALSRSVRSAIFRASVISSIFPSMNSARL